MWEAFLLPMFKISATSVIALPAIFLFISIAILWNIVSRFARTSPFRIDSTLAFGFILSWGTFIISPYSAGASKIDFFYLQNSASLRYAIAPVLITLILFASLGLRVNQHIANLILLILILILVVRILGHYQSTSAYIYENVYQFSSPVWNGFTWWFIWCLVTAFLFLYQQRLRMIPLYVCVLLSSPVVLSTNFDNNRSFGALTIYAEHQRDENGLKPNVVSLVATKGSYSNFRFWDSAFPAVGYDFTLRYLGVVDYSSVSKREIPSNVSWVSLSVNPNLPLTNLELLEISLLMSERGFNLFSKATNHFMFSRV
jgi:hypothetical protein